MRIFDNMLYKFVAVLVAALLWAAAKGVSDEERSFDLPIVVEDTPAELVVVEQSAHEVNLRISGSRAALRQAAKVLERYPVSLRGVKRGEATFSVSEAGLPLPLGARVAARSPTQVSFRTEPVETKSVPVRADVFGDPPDGLRVVEVRVEPPQVALRGARNNVRQVREVLTDRLDLSQIRENTTFDSSLVPLAVPHVWAEQVNGNGNGSGIKVHVVVEEVASEIPEEPTAPEEPEDRT